MEREKNNANDRKCTNKQSFSLFSNSRVVTAFLCCDIPRGQRINECRNLGRVKYRPTIYLGDNPILISHSFRWKFCTFEIRIGFLRKLELGTSVAVSAHFSISQACTRFRVFSDGRGKKSEETKMLFSAQLTLVFFSIYLLGYSSLAV